MFDSINLDESSSHLGHTSNIVFKDDSWFVILSKSTLLHYALMYVAHPDYFLCGFVEGYEF